MLIVIIIIDQEYFYIYSKTQQFSHLSLKNNLIIMQKPKYCRPSTDPINPNDIEIQIKLKTMNGSIYFIKARSLSTVASIQSQIQDKTGVPVDSQRLLHKAVLLEPNQLLSDYMISDGTTIQLVANMLPQQISSPSISTHRHSEVARTHALTQQNIRTKKHRYIQQRINGFNIKNQQSIQTIKQNKIVIDRLLENVNNNKQTSIQPFLLQNRQLNIGDWVDFKDVSGLWVQGQIVSKKHNFVEVHCNGYPDKWNEWIEQSSERIMPLRTQTVQFQDSPYLSPFPKNKPQIRPPKTHQKSLSTIIHELPQTLNLISSLFSELEQEKKPKYHEAKYKYSFNQQEIQQQVDVDVDEQIAQSFKNNRSHNSPPPSIHEQQYQYDVYEGEIQMDITNGDQFAENPNKQIASIQMSMSGSIKDKKVNKNIKKILGSNRYIDNRLNGREPKYIGLGYSKTRSQHEHTLNNNKPKASIHREQTPNKGIKNIGQLQIDIKKVKNERVDQIYTPNNLPSNNAVSGQGRNLVLPKTQEKYHPKQKQANIIKEKQKIIKKEKQQEIEQELEQSKEHIQYNLAYSYPNHLSEAVILNSGSKQNPSLQADNISNKCENMSNKGDHDDGESSAKSFGSKRSDRFLDASSMKSLNIDTLHNDNQVNKQQSSQIKKGKGKGKNKNIFVFDHSQAHSVKSVHNKDKNNRSNYYYNQQGILEEEDSINDQINEQYYLQKKKQMAKKLRATQLAPLCDRLGRMLVDLAPHIATLGYRQFNTSPQFSQNLSTFTNEGSLQSRFRTFNNQVQQQEQKEQKSSLQSNKFYNFQIPVMLTPWQIMKINKFLNEQARTDRDRENQ